jgi:hypothetical protein
MECRRRSDLILLLDLRLTTTYPCTAYISLSCSLPRQSTVDTLNLVSSCCNNSWLLAHSVMAEHTNVFQSRLIHS